MKFRLILCLLLPVVSILSGQQLNFSTFSSQSDVHINNDGQQFIYNIGEPLIQHIDAREGVVSQGLLNSELNTIVHNERTQIQIRVFLDKNENGLKDFDEIYTVMGKVQVVGNELYQIASDEGINYYATPGTYGFNYFNLDERFRYTTDQTIEVTTEATDVYKKVDFGISPEDVIEGAEVYLSSGAFRCFREIDYMLCFRNTGTELLESTVFLQIDNRLDSLFFPEQPDVIIDDHTVGWNFSLEPGRNRIIRYSLKAPEVDEPEDIGVVYKTSAWIDLENNLRKELCYEQELRCSYDPNDKLVYPNRPDSLALLDEEIVYTIRFQNTGNDVADDVVVVDTLDTNLDLNTFHLVNSSHPDLLEVVFDRDEQNIVNFRFKNIFLPDSIANEPGSHGHITYTIKPKEGLPKDTEINNTGYIYFDFNPAIITNTTSSTLVEEFPIVSTEEPSISWDGFYVYPNPSEGLIHLSELVDRVEVLNLDGQSIREEFDTRSLSLTNLPSATYIIRVFKDARLATKKLILINN